LAREKCEITRRDVEGGKEKKGRGGRDGGREKSKPLLWLQRREGKKEAAKRQHLQKEQGPGKKGKEQQYRTMRIKKEELPASGEGKRCVFVW